jgi:hypothetical protein
VDFVIDALIHTREHGYDIIEVDPAAEEKWTDMMNDSESRSSFLKSSYFYGSNIPGKPVRQLLNPTGRWTLQRMIADVVGNDFSAFLFSEAAEAAG